MRITNFVAHLKKRKSFDIFVYCRSNNVLTYNNTPTDFIYSVGVVYLCTFNIHYNPIQLVNAVPVGIFYVQFLAFAFSDLYISSTARRAFATGTPVLGKQ